MDKQNVYLQHILNVVHGDVRTMRFHAKNGQFNDIVIVNDELIFRFPRTFHEANILIHEVAVLRRIQNMTTLAVPHPIYVRTNREIMNENFMAYRMIPGEPLFKSILDTIKDDILLERLAAQVAQFMHELHTLPVRDIGLDVPIVDTQKEWQDLYQQFHDTLFPYMRLDACELVTHTFEAFLDEPRHFDYMPVFRHGDFGGSNILYDPKAHSITGVIDFSSAGIGDPALDVAAISCSGDAFFQRVRKAYPGMDVLLERAKFYRSTFALQEALYGLRDNDQESFEDGIAEYI